MHNKGKRNIIGILIDTVDYEAATDFCSARGPGKARRGCYFSSGSPWTHDRRA